MSLMWRKSSFSTPDSDCVEVAWPIAGAALRDSKNATGTVLLVPAESVTSLVTTLKRG